MKTLIIIIIVIAAAAWALSERRRRIRAEEALARLQIQYDLDTQALSISDMLPARKDGETEARYRYRVAMRLANEIAPHVDISGDVARLWIKE